MPMKTPEAQKLRPFRDRIDDLDAQIVALLRARYDVIEEVGRLKARENIPAVLPDRVAEVRDNAARAAGACGLDADFIAQLYTNIIAHSCALEEKIIAAAHRKAKP